MIIKKILQRRNRNIGNAQENFIAQLLNDAAFATAEASKPHHAKLTEWLDPKLGNKVLELGCGNGRYVAMLSQLGFDVTGVDPFHFDTWTQLAAKENITLQDNVKAEQLTFTDQSFDSVCCLGALLYFDDPVQAVQEMHRVLKPNGRLLLRSINGKNLYTSFTGKKLDPVSKNLYDKQQLLALLKSNGFTVHDYFAFGFFPPLFPNYYWYLQNTYISEKRAQWLSDHLPEQRRINHVIYAERT